MANKTDVTTLTSIESFVDAATGLVYLKDPFGGNEHDLVGIDEASLDQWETLEEDLGEPWNFETRSKCIGTLTHVKSVELLDQDGNVRPTNLYGFAGVNGERFSVWGTYQIDDALKGVDTTYLKRLVYIEHCGKRDQDKGRTVNVFTIRVRK